MPTPTPTLFFFPLTPQGKSLRFDASGLSAGNEGWYEVCSSGVWFSGYAGVEPRFLPTASMDEMVESFLLTESEEWYPGGIPVTVNHATHYAYDADSTRAFGRIKSLDSRWNARGGKSLWARIAWNESGMELLRELAFTGFSIECLGPGEGASRKSGEPLKGWVLTGLSLTNTPMVIGMEPITGAPSASASEDVMSIHRPSPSGQGAYLFSATSPPPSRERRAMPNESKPMSLFDAVALHFSAPTVETETAVKGLLALGQPPELMISEAPPKDHALLSERVELLSRQVDRLSRENAEKDQRLKDVEEEAWSRALDSGVREGRIAPTERAEYRDVVARMGQAFADKIYPAGRTGVGVNSSGHSGTSAVTGSADPEEEILRLSKEMEATVPGGTPAARYQSAVLRLQALRPDLFAALGKGA